MNIQHEVDIDLAYDWPVVSPSIYVMQGDGYSRSIAFRLTSNGRPWPIPDGVGVCVGYQKPDGTAGLYDTLPDGTAAWSIAENVVTVAIAPQAMTTAGKVSLAISLLLGEMVLSTFPVNLFVEAFPGFEGSSEDYARRFGLLPGVDQNDNGKMLQVIDGQWKVVPMMIAEEESV